MERPHGKVRYFCLEGGHAQANLGCLGTNTQSLAYKKKNWKSMHSQSVLISSGSRRLNGIASMTGRMSWRLFKEKTEEWSCTFLQSISLSMLRSSVKPQTYLTVNSWSKAKAKETRAIEPGPVTHHLFKGKMKWIILYTNNAQNQPTYQTYSSLEPHGTVQTIQGISRLDG